MLLTRPSNPVLCIPMMKAETGSHKWCKSNGLRMVEPGFEPGHAGPGAHSFNSVLNAFLSVGKSTKGWSCWPAKSQVVTRLRGIRSLNERIGTDWSRETKKRGRTTPSGSWIGMCQSLPFFSWSGVYLEGEGWQMLHDCWTAVLVDRTGMKVCSNLLQHLLTWSSDLFMDLWALSSILGSPVCSYAAAKDKSVHCLMGNRPSQHFVSSTTCVRCFHRSSRYHQQLMLLGYRYAHPVFYSRVGMLGLQDLLDVHRCC